MEEVSSKDKGASGGLLVEAIIVLGLIATLTPILYKHVSERRQDIDNINEANTLLLLKNATAEYIEANKESLLVGTTVLEPADIGMDISGYRIGIKKDDDGTVSAMIAASGGGNDLRAAKVASLLGVSAGIYSAQNTEKAWGINGVWAEDISNYGFTSLPTGIPVITTAYDAETPLNMDKIFTAIEEHEFEALSAKQIKSEMFCLNEDCINEWQEAAQTPLQLIINCNMGDSKSCKRAYQKGQINLNCETIGNTFMNHEGEAQSGFYTFSLSESNYSKNNLCFFINNESVTAEEILNGCNNNGNSTYCRLGYNYNLNRSCEEVIQAAPSAASGYYNLTTSGSYIRTPCLFVDQRIATAAEAISMCTASRTFACAYGWHHNINRNCERIIKSNSLASTGFYFLTSDNSGSAANRPCVFYNEDIASASQVIIQCNAANNTNNAACRYGFNENLNRTCAQVIYNYPSGANNYNTITEQSSVNRQYCINCSTSRVIASAVSSGTFSAPCSGTYTFTVSGVATSAWCNYTYNYPGSLNSGSGIYSAGTSFRVSILPGTAAKYCTSSSQGTCRWYTYGSTGGNGIGVYIGNSLLISAKGGDGFVGKPWCVNNGAGGSNNCNLTNCNGTSSTNQTTAFASITYTP